MRLMILTAAMISLVSGAVHAEEWGNLKVKFVYDGKAPTQKEIDVTRDKAFCGQHELLDESLVVGADGELQNVVLYAYTGRGGKELSAVHPDLEGKTQTVTLANKNCRFEPHVAICRKGDTLKVTNPDEVGHNANMNFLNNPAQNLTIPAGAFIDVSLGSDEPAPIPVECNIHPWMQAKVVVTDHPYAAVSGKDGVLEIKNLPVGEVAFRVYHESAKRLRGLEVGGEELDRRSVVVLDIKPGDNDLGVVKIDAKMFN